MLDFVEERGFVFGCLFSQSCPAEGSVVLVCFAVFFDSQTTGIIATARKRIAIENGRFSVVAFEF